MLTEYLLTPDVLSDSDGRDGTDVVRDLKNCFFPFAATPTALVCRLGGEEWTRAVSTKIARIPNVNHRQLAMSLMTQLVEQLAVTRPAVRRPSEDEAGWIAAGVQSSAQVRLGKVVVSGQATPPTNLGTSLREFVSPAFWELLPNPRLVGREIATQEGVLRAVCTHSEWIVVRLPQIRGGGDDEIVTVKQIVTLANRLPVGFRKTEIDLHICVPSRIPEANLLTGVKAELQRFVRDGITINVATWPEKHFVNRELVAGEYATTSPGVKVRKPLWWITMTHVAVGGRNAASAGEAGNTWSLFPRQKAHERYEKIKAETPLNLVTLR